MNQIAAPRPQSRRFGMHWKLKHPATIKNGSLKGVGANTWMSGLNCTVNSGYSRGNAARSMSTKANAQIGLTRKTGKTL